MTRFITSDIHINHVTLAAKWRLGPGFDGTVETHNETIKARWNAIVRPDDEVWVIGDAVMGVRQVGLTWWAENLNGKCTLVPGNHDKVARLNGAKAADAVAMYSEVFTIAPEMIDGSDVGYPGFVLCHYPWSDTLDHDAEGTRSVIADYGPKRDEWPEGTVVVHGHTHSSQPVADHAIHVGIDTWQAPVPIEFVLEYAEAARIFPASTTV